MPRAPRKTVRPAVLQLEAIGVARTPFKEKSAVPRQPALAEGALGTIELSPTSQMADALSDLASFSHVWVIFWFHEAEGWRPKVLPPRSEVKRGVFATRSPHRPNALGLSVLKLERIEGTTLHVRGVDMLDGTPVLDLKPYVPYADVVQASSGWLETASEHASAEHARAAERATGQPATTDAATRDPGPSFEVSFSERAQEQLAFLGAYGQRLQHDATRVLAAGPAPHPYRRIRRDGDRLRLSVRDFRLYFTLRGSRVQVEEVTTGYRAATLADPRAEPSADTPLELHRALVARFGG